MKIGTEEIPLFTIPLFSGEILLAIAIILLDIHVALAAIALMGAGMLLVFVDLDRMHHR